MEQRSNKGQKRSKDQGNDSSVANPNVNRPMFIDPGETSSKSSTKQTPSIERLQVHILEARQFEFLRLSR